MRSRDDFARFPNRPVVIEHFVTLRGIRLPGIDDHAVPIAVAVDAAADQDDVGLRITVEVKEAELRVS